MRQTPRTIRASHGTQLTCKSWIQEAALRMLMNNLDPEVAEKPQELIVYGGTGKAARNWQCYDAIVDSLKNLENDETLLNVSGGASWVSVHHGGGVDMGLSIHAGMVVVADGTKEAEARLQRVLTYDPGMGIIRHADAGYKRAIENAKKFGVHIPMLT